jgi:2-C-methyl-D-erythritol 4-phosphate cytidylyltransferase
MGSKRIALHTFNVASCTMPVIQKADVIIVAAGSGARFGAPKQFALLDGMPLYQHSLKTFAFHPLIDRIILVVGVDHVTQFEKEIGSNFFGKTIELALGGTARQDSVSNGLQKLEESEHSGIVLVHDANSARSEIRIAEKGSGKCTC